MHQAGKRIVSEGYEHVVPISNYLDVDRVFQTPSKTFVEELDFVLQSDNISQEEKIFTYDGHECKWTIQDGELPGAGIYVFFKNPAGADLCKQNYIRS